MNLMMCFYEKHICRWWKKMTQRIENSNTELNIFLPYILPAKGILPYNKRTLKAHRNNPVLDTKLILMLYGIFFSFHERIILPLKFTDKKVLNHSAMHSRELILLQLVFTFLKIGCQHTSHPHLILVLLLP